MHEFVEKFRIQLNPLTTGVENECWLRGWNNFWPVQKWVLTTGMARFCSKIETKYKIL